MPLPDAVPKPAGSNIYRQLNAIKLGDLTNEQYEVLYDNIFLNDTSEDELRRLALIGLARQSFSPSSSGPIGESVTVYLDAISSGSKYAIFGGGNLMSMYSKDDEDVVFPKGSAWVCSGISWYGTGLSGSVNHDVWYYPAGVTPVVESKATLIVDLSSTGGNQPLFSSETGGLNDVLIDEDSTLWVEFTGTATSIRYSATFFRVR
tara:strand:+ start:1062 stop:1676 length:615 start_codon:yes stop_codon:yes gene_type:complete